MDVADVSLLFDLDTGHGISSTQENKAQKHDQEIFKLLQNIRANGITSCWFEHIRKPGILDCQC